MLQLLMTLFNINRAKFEVDELSLETFHGTTREIATIILNEGFKIIPKEVTNDLGNGIYTFCPDDYGCWNPEENAKRYAKQYKRGKVIVLKVIIDTSSQTTYIDLDDPVFMREWSKIREQLEHRANNIWKKYSTGSAKRRHNIDGILLELAIKRNMLSVSNPDFVVKCTYTCFIPKSMSNMPNGRKLVVRNLEIITDVKEV